MTPGYKTKAFWIALAVSIAGAVFGTGLIDEGMAGQVAGYVVTLGAVLGYTIHRGFVKSDGTVSKPGWKTSEFWLNVGAIAVAAAIASGAFIDNSTAMTILVGAGSLFGALGYKVNTKQQNDTAALKAELSRAPTPAFMKK